MNLIERLVQRKIERGDVGITRSHHVTMFVWMVGCLVVALLPGVPPWVSAVYGVMAVVWLLFFVGAMLLPGYITDRKDPTLRESWRELHAEWAITREWWAERKARRREEQRR